MIHRTIKRLEESEIQDMHMPVLHNNCGFRGYQGKLVAINHLVCRPLRP